MVYKLITGGPHPVAIAQNHPTFRIQKSRLILMMIYMVDLCWGWWLYTYNVYMYIFVYISIRLSFSVVSVAVLPKCPPYLSQLHRTMFFITLASLVLVQGCGPELSRPCGRSRCKAYRRMIWMGLGFQHCTCFDMSLDIPGVGNCPILGILDITL